MNVSDAEINDAEMSNADVDITDAKSPAILLINLDLVHLFYDRL